MQHDTWTKKTFCTTAVTAKRADGPCISRRPQCTQLPAGRSPFLYTPTETQCVPPVLQKKHTLVQEAIAQCFKKASIKKKNLQISHCPKRRPALCTGASLSPDCTHACRRMTGCHFCTCLVVTLFPMVFMTQQPVGDSNSFSPR